VHVDEDLAEPAIHVLAGTQMNLVAADDRLLRIAVGAGGEPAAVAAPDDALDDPFDDSFDDPLGDERGARNRRLPEEV
jgi:hypothetical protein